MSNEIQQLLPLISLAGGVTAGLGSWPHDQVLVARYLGRVLKSLTKDPAKIAPFKKLYHSNFLDYTSPFYFSAIKPPVAAKKFWGFSKRNSHEKLRHPVLSLLGELHHRLHQKILRELIGVINFTSVTPENPWGINNVILEGPMVNGGSQMGA